MSILTWSFYSSLTWLWRCVTLKDKVMMGTTFQPSYLVVGFFDDEALLSSSWVALRFLAQMFFCHMPPMYFLPMMHRASCLGLTPYHLLQFHAVSCTISKSSLDTLNVIMSGKPTLSYYLVCWHCESLMASIRWQSGVMVNLTCFDGCSSRQLYSLTDLHLGSFEQVFQVLCSIGPRESQACFEDCNSNWCDHSRLLDNIPNGNCRNVPGES